MSATVKIGDLVSFLPRELKVTELKGDLAMCHWKDSDKKEQSAWIHVNSLRTKPPKDELLGKVIAHFS